MIADHTLKQRRQMAYILNNAAYTMEDLGRLGHEPHPLEGVSVDQALRMAAGATNRDRTMTVSLGLMSAYTEVLALLRKHYGPDLDENEGTPVLFRRVAEWVISGQH